ncbi:MAG: putative sugar nucleotidyl transferase [Patescibacteria group bacterium]|nr:putative sugar nucleotidyl transferase [Patescibacteria group bacterium]MDD5715133.1 putative sugar nucleotidyl transferase [Patescibacteria group bacterium]
MNLCIFEDEASNKFFPLSLTRPVYELRIGLFTFEERIRLLCKTSTCFYYSRPQFKNVIRSCGKKIFSPTVPLKYCIFINGRILPSKHFIAKLQKIKNDTLFISNKELVGAVLTGSKIKLAFTQLFWQKRIAGAKKIFINEKTISSIWQIVKDNDVVIEQDRHFLKNSAHHSNTIFEGAHLLNQKNIYIGSRSIVYPSTVIDAQNGFVYIGNSVTIHSNCSIKGPCAILSGSTINSNAVIGPGTSIGPKSKIGGEVTHTIIQGYTNKQHEGFLGHSYIGSWCNIGAGSSNSDLKNNYGSVSVLLDRIEYNTHQQFVGLFMGDHSKAGIGTLFNTGTVVGIGVNVFGGGITPKYIPSFSWLNLRGTREKYKFDKFIKTARIVQKRRGITLSAAETSLLKKIAKVT